MINAFGPEATPYLVSAWRREPTVLNKAARAIWRLTHQTAGKGCLRRLSQQKQLESVRARFTAKFPPRQSGFVSQQSDSKRSLELVARLELHATAQQDFLADRRSVALLEQRLDPRIATHPAPPRLLGELH